MSRSCRAGRSGGRRAAKCSARRPAPAMKLRPMDLLDKLRAAEQRGSRFAALSSMPGHTTIERVIGPCEVVIQGRPTLMFGSNNYLGLTVHPHVIAAAQRAAAEYGAGTTGSRTANGSLAIHEELEQEFATWFGKRH